MTTRTLIAAMILTLFTACFAAAPLAADEPEKAAAQVTYLTGSSVYIDAGSDDGLRPGDLVELMSGEQVVMVLRVRDVSSRKAACVPQDQELSLTGLVKTGDTVRFERREPEPAAVPAGATEPAGEKVTPAVVAHEPQYVPAGSNGPSAFGGIDGRVGLAWLLVNDRENDSGGFSRPALTLRLDGDRLGDSPFSLHIDTRLRRTTRNFDDESVNNTRLYRFSAEWQRQGSPYRLSLGRQYSPGLSGLTLFDGLLAERRTDRWAFGLFAGTQPDYEDYGFSSDTTQYGVYAQRASLPDAEKQWELTGGLAASYGKGEDFREFLFLQANYFTQRWTLSLNQEVDYNRDWKSDAGESTIQPTSTFAIARYRLTDNLTINAGYDDRRNVILYREFENPETEFDDANRRGLWGGADLQFLRRFRAGVNYRGNSGGDAGSSSSATLTLGARDLFPFHLDIGTRSTRFTNDRMEGWLHSLNFYLPAGRRTQFSIYGGLRQDDSLTALSEDLASQTLVWYGAEMNLRFGRAWFFLISLERNSGDLEDFDQLYTMLSYRF
jgi:hypothetical protein